MPYFRRPKNQENPYAQIHNRILEDEDLSLKAKGLLCYLLSKSDDWEVFQSQLENIGPDGEKAVRSALDELRKNDYVHRFRPRDESGKFRGYLYIICEEPRSIDAESISRFSETGKSSTGKSSTGKPSSTNKGFQPKKDKTKEGSCARPRGAKAPVSLEQALEFGDKEDIPPKVVRKWWNYYNAHGWPDFEDIGSALRYWNANEEDFGGSGPDVKRLQSVSDLHGRRLTESEMNAACGRFDALERSDFGFVGENPETGKNEYQLLEPTE